MKQPLYLLFLLIVSICTFSFIKVKGDNLPLIGKTIYLDAGHDCIGNSK